jgi:hypothetical protein
MSPNGSFLFANVPPGRYRIQARGETEREGLTLFQQFTLPVGGADQTVGRMLLLRGAVVSGRVEWSSNSGRVPMSRDGISVRAPMADGNTFGDALTGDIDADEQWSIRGVMAGEHVFRMEGLPEGWHLQSVDLLGRDITDVPYLFEYNQVVPCFRIVLTDLASRVFGYLTPYAREDPQSFAVVVFSENAVYWRPDSRHVRLVYPDATGRFSVTGLPPGRYMIAAALDIDASDLARPEVFDALRSHRTTETFVLEEGKSRRVDIRPAIRTARDR